MAYLEMTSTGRNSAGFGGKNMNMLITQVCICTSKRPFQKVSLAVLQKMEKRRNKGLQEDEMSLIQLSIAVGAFIGPLPSEDH